jgi:hypothetical protein
MRITIFFAFMAVALAGLTACGTFQRSPESGYAASSGYEGDDVYSSDRGPASLNAPVPLPLPPSHVENLINSNDIAIGMSRHDVRESWGIPKLVEVAGAEANGNERWTYQEDIATREGYMLQKKIILFRTDRVVGWKTVTNQN